MKRAKGSEGPPQPSAASPPGSQAGGHSKTAKRGPLIAAGRGRQSSAHHAPQKAGQHGTTPFFQQPGQQTASDTSEGHPLQSGSAPP